MPWSRTTFHLQSTRTSWTAFTSVLRKISDKQGSIFSTYRVKSCLLWSLNPPRILSLHLFHSWEPRIADKRHLCPRCLPWQHLITTVCPVTLALLGGLPINPLPLWLLLRTRNPLAVSWWTVMESLPESVVPTLPETEQLPKPVCRRHPRRSRNGLMPRILSRV